MLELIMRLPESLWDVGAIGDHSRIGVLSILDLDFPWFIFGWIDVIYTTYTNMLTH